MQKVAIIGTGITALSIGYHLPRLLPHASITFLKNQEDLAVGFLQGLLDRIARTCLTMGPHILRKKTYVRS